MLERQLTILVGPPGSGKSTLSKKFVDQGYTYVNQDLQGKGHLDVFDKAILAGQNVIVDRMNFSKGQRARYIDMAKSHGYWVTIFVLHESHATCFKRVMDRKDHLTIKDERSARAALTTFFTKYERVQDEEADDVIRVWPAGDKPMAIICDLDGTLCNVEHRRHFVRVPEGQKKDWKGFFDGIANDEINPWCADILRSMDKTGYQIVYCSGRADNYKKVTMEWLEKYNMLSLADSEHGTALYMRHRNDSRQDYIVKEIILDFEIATRFTVFFTIDDRKQVVDMWRRRGITCLQCDEGDF